MADRWSYFELSEFDCKCGCGKNNIDETLVDRLDRARRIAGVPFNINSACRCVDHNASVGGKTTSSHLGGKAVDIRLVGSGNRFIILNALYKAGFVRIGLASSFIHVDCDTDKPPKVLWLYK